ncbi:hypothetical protein AMECASPLE_008005 [Ameca splendens]|uniref:Uncharacterized protein n=1 Tax=Ameca splendens TaxID=208324 RepID=A0ABV0ZM37_9TELE
MCLRFDPLKCTPMSVHLYIWMSFTCAEIVAATSLICKDFIKKSCKPEQLFPNSNLDASNGVVQTIFLQPEMSHCNKLSAASVKLGHTVLKLSSSLLTHSRWRCSNLGQREAFGVRICQNAVKHFHQTPHDLLYFS